MNSIRRFVRKSFRFSIFRVGILLVWSMAANSIIAQSTFDSGSTGADGALAPGSNLVLQIPESGVFNFTTINIPSGVTVTFLPNSTNSPVTLLASGSVTIAGTISVNGGNAPTTLIGGAGGPGGFRGGNGSLLVDMVNGSRGDGPGGGSGAQNKTSGTGGSGGGGGGFGAAGLDGGGAVAPYGKGGLVYGSLSLLPLIGGSGGGGGSTGPSTVGTAGGGGGGAILIASSSTITLTGSITAKGGNGAAQYYPGTGGGGSGGAVRLIANTITGSGSVDVRGGSGGAITWGCPCGGTGGRGHVRAEAYDYSSFNPNLFSVPIVLTLPNPVSIPNSAKVAISKIAGVNVPVATKGSLYSNPDIVLPGSLANPVTVEILATNVPTGSIVQLSVAPPSGERTTFQSTPLSGDTSSSTATASINLPSGVSVVTASLTVDIQAANLPPMFIDGQKVTRLEVTASLGRASETTYVTASGKRYKSSELSQ